MHEQFVPDRAPSHPGTFRIGVGADLGIQLGDTSPPLRKRQQALNRISIDREPTRAAGTLACRRFESACSLPDQRCDLVAGQRRAQPEPLPERAAVFDDAQSLRVRLDPLGKRRQAKVVRELDGGPRETRLTRPAGKVAYERPIDLEDVRRKVPEPGERRVARP